MTGYSAQQRDDDAGVDHAAVDFDTVGVVNDLVGELVKVGGIVEQGARTSRVVHEGIIVARNGELLVTLRKVARQTFSRTSDRTVKLLGQRTLVAGGHLADVVEDAVEVDLFTVAVPGAGVALGTAAHDKTRSVDG
jgi:hypothetical protein